MRPRIEDIQQIVELVAGSSIDELRLETGDFKLTLRRDQAPAESAARSGRAAPGSGSRPVRGAGSAAGLGLQPPVEPDPPAPRRPFRARREDAAQRPSPPGAVEVTAPVVGTFYRAPAPGAPPFVEVGSLVEPDDAVGIVEVMKLMNEIRAGCRGRIFEICAENGEPVEYGQLLLVIEPTG